MKYNWPILLGIILILGGLSPFILFLPNLDNPFQKYLFTITNNLFFLLPFTIISTGIAIWRKPKTQVTENSKMSGDSFKMVGVLLIIVAFVTFVAWFIAAAGA